MANEERMTAEMSQERCKYNFNSRSPARRNPPNRCSLCSAGSVAYQIRPFFVSVSAISAANCCSKAVVLPELPVTVVVEADQTTAKSLAS